MYTSTIRIADTLGLSDYRSPPIYATNRLISALPLAVPYRGQWAALGIWHRGLPL